MKISIVIASAANGCIGKNNTLPWSLPKDMKRFKEITSSQLSIVIMGRKTYESIGRPLPNRINFVLSSDKNYNPHPDVFVMSNLEEAISKLDEVENAHEEDYNAFIIGGAGLFKESIEKGLADTIFHTLVEADIDGDTFIELPEWNITDEVSIPADEKHQYSMKFRTLNRA